MTAIPPPPTASPAEAPCSPREWRADEIAVLLCSDVSDAADAGPCPVPAAAIAAALRERAPALRVLTAPRLCARAGGLGTALRSLGVQRAVAGCRHAAGRRGEIAAGLRQAGIHQAGIGVVDLMPSGTPASSRVIRQSAVRLLAAAARVGQADIGAPVRERVVDAGQELTRGGLFHPGSRATVPVACWSGGRCGGQNCQACASACPYGALRVTSAGVLIDAAACTGCGCCVAACRTGGMSLAGWTISGLEAAARELAAEALRPAPDPVHGVAITCVRAAGRIPVGSDWLPLDVPSLDIVSAGWPLQLLDAGLSVAFVACVDDRCAGRARELDQLCAELAEVTDAGWHPLGTPIGGWAPAQPGDRVQAVGGSAEFPLPLREPEATVWALAKRTARPWRIESPVLAIGEVSVDASRCSACGCCVMACPAGALSVSNNGATLILSADTAQCTACGACVRACPEAAVSVRRATSSASIALGRRPVASVVAGDRCASCGRPLAGGLSANAVAVRLAASHPRIAARLSRERRCTDCLLTGNTHRPRPQSPG